VGANDGVIVGASVSAPVGVVATFVLVVCPTLLGYVGLPTSPPTNWAKFKALSRLLKLATCTVFALVSSRIVFTASSQN